VSIQDERELRSRLGGLLDNVELATAPVASAMRRGKVIRMRRWVSAAAGVAVLAAGAVVLPVLLARQSASPIAPGRHHVVVSPIGPHAQPGLIGHGTTDGHRWTALLSWDSHNGLTLTGNGLPSWASYGNTNTQFASGPAAITSTGSHAQVLEFGTVRADVTHVTVSLGDGEFITLTPVSWRGQRWVAVLLPARVPMARAVLYTSSGELAYAVPFRGSELNVWWKPGQTGPARITMSVGSGVVDGHPWHVTADFGPWGYCYRGAGSSTCIDSTTNPNLVPARTLVSPMICGSLDAAGVRGARAGFAVTAAAVRRIVVTYSGGRTATYATVTVGSDRMFGFAVPGGHKIVRLREYGAAGQLLGSARGRDLLC
jgi:hypothetical protein